MLEVKLGGERGGTEIVVRVQGVEPECLGKGTNGTSPRKSDGSVYAVPMPSKLKQLASGIHRHAVLGGNNFSGEVEEGKIQEGSQSLVAVLRSPMSSIQRNSDDGHRRFKLGGLTQASKGVLDGLGAVGKECRNPCKTKGNLHHGKAVEKLELRGGRRGFDGQGRKKGYVAGLHLPGRAK
jgi:hypothetical protein